MNEFRDKTITIKDIQAATGLSLSWLRQLTREGKLKGVRTGREYLYSAGQVNAALGTAFRVRQVVSEPSCLEDLG